MNSIEKRFENLKSEFNELEQWSLRYQHLVEMGKSLPPLSDNQKQDSNLIQGCVSKVWLGADMRSGKLFFWGDSDGIMPKGLVALTSTIFSNTSPQEILAFQAPILSELGLLQNLTPTRAKAMENMLRRVKELAALALKETQA
jgi:cysteine desulfuration protein SufE